MRRVWDCSTGLNATTVLQLCYSFTPHFENQGGDPGQAGYDITSLGLPASLAAEEVYNLLPFVIFNDVGGGVGGWTANVITYWSTGVPIASPSVGAGTSYFNQRPYLTCNPGSGAPHTAATWFNFACFAIPASPFVAGNAPAYLDHVRTMGAQDFDISLYKSFTTGNEKSLRFEVASYNVANRAQLGTPGTPSITSVQSDPSQAAAFGQITTTVNTPRQFQFGSRFIF